MSLRYTNTNRFKLSLRMSLMRGLKIAGAFVRPKGMTKYSKWPKGVLKAVFHTNTGSSLVKMGVPWMGSNAGVMSGRGYLSLSDLS